MHPTHPIMCILSLALYIILPFHVLAQDLVFYARQSSLPNGFSEVGIPPSDTSINLRIGLKALDNAGLEQKLYKISTPGSDYYGQHLTRDQVGNPL